MRRRLGVYLAMMMTMQGCAMLHPPGPPPPDFAGGPDVVVAWLREHVGGAVSVRAMIQVSLSAPRRNASFDALLFSAPPGRVRLQGFSPLGQRLFDLVAQGDAVSLRLERNQRVVEGTVDQLGDKLKLPALPQLLTLLTTMTFVTPDASQHPALEPAAAGDPPQLVISVDGADGRRLIVRRVWLRPDGLPQREAWFDDAGQQTALVRYDQYERAGERWRPKRIDAELSGDVSIHLLVKAQEQNPVWQPGDFELQGEAHAAARS